MRSTESVILLKKELEEATTDHVSLETQLRLLKVLPLRISKFSTIEISTPGTPTSNWNLKSS